MKKLYLLSILFCILSCSKSDNSPNNNTSSTPVLIGVLWKSSTSDMPYCTSSSWVSYPGFSIELFSNGAYTANVNQSGTWYWLTNPTELILSGTSQTDDWKGQMFITNLTTTSVTFTNEGGCSITYSR